MEEGMKYFIIVILAAIVIFGGKNLFHDGSGKGGSNSSGAA